MNSVVHQATHDWLESPIGKSLLAREEELVEEAFDSIFGEECVQLGCWGGASRFGR